MYYKITVVLCCDSQVDPVGHELNMLRINDRLTGMFGVINVYRIIRGLLKLAPQQHERVPLIVPIVRPNGVTAVVSGQSAVKTVPNCDAFFQEYGTSYEEVQV